MHVWVEFKQNQQDAFVHPLSPKDTKIQETSINVRDTEKSVSAASIQQVNLAVYLSNLRRVCIAELSAPKYTE